jgi:hypothetical protein
MDDHDSHPGDRLFNVQKVQCEKNEDERILQVLAHEEIEAIEMGHLVQLMDGQ